MDTDKLIIESLEDQNVLIEAYAASSSYVMRKAFAASEKLDAFKGRNDLAPTILSRIEQLTKKPSDPVIFGAHLYALELTNAKPEIRAAVLHVLEKEELQNDPLVGQIAGEIGFKQVAPKKQLTPGAYLTVEELQGVVEALRQEGGH